MRRLLVVVLVFSAALAAVADKLVLKDGRKYEGTVLEETDLIIKFRTAKAVLTFKKEEIESLERGKTIVAEREDRLTALKPENPAAYLEMAEWLQGPGKELFDEAMFTRLCNIAAFLDKGLACKAQLMIGRYLLSKGRKEAAALCYFRARTADPANEEAAAKAKDLKAGLDAVAKTEMTAISRALTTFLDGKTKEAIPLLREVEKKAFSERAKEFMTMTIAELADELQSRVPCESCKGKGKSSCTPCKGKGFITCELCGGTGVKKSLPKNPTFKQEVCRDCYHAGNLLCQSCLAERTAKIHFSGEQEVVVVQLQAGVEHVGFSQYINLGSWTRKKTGNKVTMIEFGSLTKGGIRTCPDCRGIVYRPPTHDIDKTPIMRYREELDARITGKVDIDPPPESKIPYEDKWVKDKNFRYEEGEWVE